MDAEYGLTSNTASASPNSLGDTPATPPRLRPKRLARFRRATLQESFILTKAQPGLVG